MADGRDEIRQKDRPSNKYTAKKAAQERIAAQRDAQRRAERRRNLMVAGGSTLAVLIVVGALVGIGIATKKKSGGAGAGNAVVAASSAVTSGITKTAGLASGTPDLSTVAGMPTKISSTALTGSSGKPEVLYVGADYCPYCAATRWPLAVALSRFGTLSNLKTTYSSDTDSAGPHTPTLSFYKSSYSSQYIDFVGKEQEDGVGKPLEKLTKSEDDVFTSLGGGAYPFIDFNGKWMQHGSAFDPKLLSGMTPDQVATTMSDPSSKAGAVVQADADVFTAIICGIDGGKPTDVCTAPGVQAAQAKLGGK